MAGGNTMSGNSNGPGKGTGLSALVGPITSGFGDRPAFSRMQSVGRSQVPLVMSERFRRSSTAKFIDESYRRSGRGASNAPSSIAGTGLLTLDESTEPGNTKRRTGKTSSKRNGRSSASTGSNVDNRSEPGEVVAAPLPQIRPRGATLIRSMSSNSARDALIGLNLGGGGTGGNGGGASGSAGAGNNGNGSGNGNGGGGAGGAASAQNAGESLGTDDLAYTPFPLSSASSFNPKNLNPRQIERMDPLTRAKYMAYEKPPPNAVGQLLQSEKRSRQWLRDEHRRTRQVIETERKKWMLIHKAIEDPNSKQVGEELAAMARKRIHQKIRKIIETREEELQFLVEGQSTSIDAIRLKEHLVIRDNKPKVDKLFNEKDRLRVEELLEQGNGLSQQFGSIP